MYEFERVLKFCECSWRKRWICSFERPVFESMPLASMSRIEPSTLSEDEVGCELCDDEWREWPELEGELPELEVELLGPPKPF